MTARRCRAAVVTVRLGVRSIRPCRRLDIRGCEFAAVWCQFATMTRQALTDARRSGDGQAVSLDVTLVDEALRSLLPLLGLDERVLRQLDLLHRTVPSCL
jgi:hypothetical protein